MTGVCDGHVWRGSVRAVWCVRRADAGGVCGWDTFGPEPGVLAGAGSPGRQAALRQAQPGSQTRLMGEGGGAVMGRGCFTGLQNGGAGSYPKAECSPETEVKF